MPTAGSSGQTAECIERSAFESRRFHYTGPSMRPLMRAGDVLVVECYGGRSVRRGDVIAFRPKKGERTITHRVVAVGAKGVRTRGDNNSSVDPWLLTKDEIIGRVVRIRRGHHDVPVPGGYIGVALGLVLRSLMWIRSVALALLRPGYLALARSGIVRRLLPRPLEVRVARFSRGDYHYLILLHRDREIGRLLPGVQCWSLRRPYRLLIDERSLPVDLSPSSDQDIGPGGPQ